VPEVEDKLAHKQRLKERRTARKEALKGDKEEEEDLGARLGGVSESEEEREEEESEEEEEEGEGEEEGEEEEGGGRGRGERKKREKHGETRGG
jgi:hypothetical protein